MPDGTDALNSARACKVVSWDEEDRRGEASTGTAIQDTYQGLELFRVTVFRTAREESYGLYLAVPDSDTLHVAQGHEDRGWQLVQEVRVGAIYLKLAFFISLLGLQEL